MISGIRLGDTAAAHPGGGGAAGAGGDQGLFTYFQGLWTEIASQNVAYDLRNELQRKITLLSFSFHDQAEAGDLLSRAIQDVERIRFLTGRATFRVIEGVFLMLITAGGDDLDEPAAGAAGDPAMPLLAFQSIRFGRALPPALGPDPEAAGRADHPGGAEPARGAGGEDLRPGRCRDRALRAGEPSAGSIFQPMSARLQSINMPLLHLIANLSSVAILWYGGMLVINDQLTLGELVAFTTYVAQLVSPVRYLGMILPAIAMASASAERVFEILDTVPEVREDPDAAALSHRAGHVRFENVSFSYGAAQRRC